MTKIKDVDKNTLNPFWLAEFRGFFFGEGYLGIIKNGRARDGYISYVARAQITLRADDIDVLNDISAKLGGLVYLEGRGRKTTGADNRIYQSKPYAVWRITKASKILEICEILKDGLLPAKKMREIETVREFVTMRVKKGKGNKDEFTIVQKRRDELHKQIKELHRYK